MMLIILAYIIPWFNLNQTWRTLFIKKSVQFRKRFPIFDTQNVWESNPYTILYIIRSFDRYPWINRPVMYWPAANNNINC